MAKSIVLFSKDLRLKDNLALYNACQQGDIIPVFLFDKSLYGKTITRSFLWLSKALINLNKLLNNNLFVLDGNIEKSLKKIILDYNIDSVFYNINYEPKFIKFNSDLDKIFKKNNVKIYKYNSNFLFNPDQLLKKDGDYYKVFTPFYKSLIQKISSLRKSVNIPKKIVIINNCPEEFKLSNQNFIREINFKKFEHLLNQWDISEKEAYKRIDSFIQSGKINNYKIDRDYVCKNGTSIISPYMHWGQVSVVDIYYKLMADRKIDEENRDFFIRELIVREFCNYLLYYYPKINSENFNSKFDYFLWGNDAKLLKVWQDGKTGIPIVDAGMRELKQTGYMHNRARMIVASFLVKNLLIDWRIGLKWFEDMLFDADLAANSFSWQWTSGAGFDAAPYFRIFNPTLQSQKFDPNGDYIRKYVPELKNVNKKYIHEPSKMPEEYANSISFVIGKTYPSPIVDLKDSRNKALEIYKLL